MDRTFPEFSLDRLMQTVFAPKGGERIAVLIDLPDTALAKGFGFLKRSELTIQRLAHDVFYKGLPGAQLFAYAATGGSNLDLPPDAVSPDGRIASFEKDLYPRFDIFLCISTFSATAPLTAAARRFGFRGATMHGLNEIILRTGLAVDYNEVSRNAEKLRVAMTRADCFEIDFEALGQTYHLRLDCGGQEAQKSHGLVRGEKPDVANLPAGEVYFVPTGAEGNFPMRYEDGTLGLMEVREGSVRGATLLKGSEKVIRTHNEKLIADPATGALGELGFGTQDLPPAGRDIQDEKILGTLHVATGRSDHLGGDITTDKFRNARNATHEDILFSPTKTPEILVRQARMKRGGTTQIVIENYRPADYLTNALA